MQGRLTLIHILILAGFILFSGLIIYQSACFLVGNIEGVRGGRQTSFSVELLRYFWVISVFTILVGSVMYWKVTRSMLRPIEDLKKSVQEIRKGCFPAPMKVNGKQDEISELISHFNDLNLQLQRNEESRNRMLSDISHELRTPTSNLKGYLEALNKGVIAGSPEIYQSLADEADRLTDLLSQIDWIKEWDGSKDNSPITPEKIKIDEVIQRVAQLFSLEFERKNIKLAVTAEPALLIADSRGIQQVITNLLRNALSYYEGEGAVTLVGEIQKSFYVISVTGPGQPIPEEERTRIFERLYRIDASRNRRSGGSGLGLAISKEIVERHRGILALETDGNLHQFIVKLPVAE